MTCLSDDLKAPLSICSAAFLSVLNDPKNCEIVNEPTGIINTVATVVMPIFAVIGAFFSIPLWLAGELIEVFNDKHNEYLDEKVELPETAADDVTLCPDKTKYLGFPVSTYQYTADENFCKDSV